MIQRQDDVLEPVYEADPDGRPVVHHRTVDTLGIMLRAGTITKEMHDAARDFQAQFTIARFDVVRLHAADAVCRAAAARPISPMRRSMRAVVSVQRSTRSAASAAPPARCVWHVVGLQRSIREWAMRQGWGGGRCSVEQAQGILIAALGTLAGHYGYEKKQP